MHKPINEVLPEGQIRAKAMCLIFHNGKVLAARGFDDVANETFYRIIGGTVEFGETGEQAVRREIMEELDSEIVNLTKVDVIENIFTYRGQAGHQITFLFKGDLSRKDIYKHKIIKVQESTYEFEAEWVSCDDILQGKTKLYPEYNYSEVFEGII